MRDLEKGGQLGAPKAKRTNSNNTFAKRKPSLKWSWTVGKGTSPGGV